MDDCVLRYAAKMAKRPLLTSSITTGVRRHLQLKRGIRLLTFVLSLDALWSR
jgi:hypothetical protein